MEREILVIRPEKHKRRIGVLPTYAQRDRTKYTRKAKHRGQSGSAGEQHGKLAVFHVALAVATNRAFVSLNGLSVSEDRAIVSQLCRFSSVAEHSPRKR